MKYYIYMAFCIISVVFSLFYALNTPENVLASECTERLQVSIIGLGIAAFFYIKTLKHA